VGFGHLQLAGPKVNGGAGSWKVNKGSVLIDFPVRVVDGCQFGHMGVPHLVIALMSCPEV
jgi:hypothetical protein